MSDPFEDVVFSPEVVVEARALLMVRDDTSGGWVPMVGGGPCRLTIRRGSIPGISDPMYFIFVHSLEEEDSVVLRCLITKDFEYNRVTPTFHHWNKKGSKYGLAFETLADAKAFERGIRTAMRAIFEDPDEEHPQPGGSAGSELDDDETLELPVLGVDSRSASDSSLRDSSQTTPQEQATQMSHFFNPRSEEDNPTVPQKSDDSQPPAEQEPANPDAGGAKSGQQDSSGSPEKKGTEDAPETAAKPPERERTRPVRQRCRYCHEIYVEQNNRRGACEYAPDCVRSTIDEVACVRAARCMMYHCMSDEEGEFVQHPCQCTCEDDGPLRWMALGFLSIFVPCLCLFPPLRSCHWCFSRAGFCGGRHRSAS